MQWERGVSGKRVLGVSDLVIPCLVLPGSAEYVLTSVSECWRLVDAVDVLLWLNNFVKFFFELSLNPVG